MNLERRQAWPALMIMGVAVLTLAVTLKAAQQDMPVQPVWVMGVLAGLYVVLGLLAEGFTWRTAVLVAAMPLTHLFMALMMGWGYAAVEGQPRGVVEALQHGLWDYLPGTALQFGFACMLGIVLDVWLEPVPEREEPEAEEVPARRPVPEIAQADSLADALSRLVAVPGVAAALAGADDVQAAGVWERDPQAALQRVLGVTSRSGAGLNTLSLDAVSLLTRAEDGQVAALLVGRDIEQTQAHELLRQLWAVGQREWQKPVEAEQAVE